MMFSKAAPSEDPEYYDNLASEQRKKGNRKKEAANLKKALEIRSSKLSEDDMGLIKNHHDLGIAYRLSGDASHAAEELELAVQLCNRYHPGETDLIADSLLNLAYVNIDLKKNDAAEDCLDRCLKVRKSEKERNNRELSKVYEAYAELCRVVGNPQKRWDYANMRVEEAKKVQPVDEPLIVNALFHRAKAEYNHGLFEQCEVTLLECQARLYSFPVPDKKMESTIDDSLRVIERKLKNKDKKGFF